MNIVLAVFISVVISTTISIILVNVLGIKLIKWTTESLEGIYKLIGKVVDRQNMGR